uniref:Uncharacterized protein n=1 Tax=Amphimedon queenslandica TaxID=400682 RepID=A0A1X7VA80_AMPQE
MTYALCFTQYGSVSNWLSAIVTTKREREKEREREREREREERGERERERERERVCSEGVVASTPSSITDEDGVMPLLEPELQLAVLLGRSGVGQSLAGDALFSSMEPLVAVPFMPQLLMLPLLLVALIVLVAIVDGALLAGLGECEPRPPRCMKRKGDLERRLVVMMSLCSLTHTHTDE